MARALIEEWAKGAGLDYKSDGVIPGYTPSLGGGRKSEDICAGKLPGGADGMVAQQTYKVETQDGGSTKTVHRAVCVVDVSESMAFARTIYCRDKAYKYRFAYDVGAEGLEAIWKNEEFESVKVSRKWAVQVDPEQDENWLRQLFDPVFLDWLGENVPKRFVWELVDGKLCGTFGRQDGDADVDPDELQQLCELTSYVAGRVRSEALEQAPTGPPPDSLQAPAATEESRHVEEQVAEVEWKEPPKDMAEAVRAYRPLARRESRLGPSIFAGCLVGLAAMVFTVPFGLILQGGGFLIYVFVGIGIFLGAFIAFASWQNQVDKLAIRYGRTAFLDQYARSRHLEMEDPTAFMKQFMRVDLPGRPIAVMSGKLPGTRRKGHLAVCHSADIPFQLAIVRSRKRAGAVDADGTGPDLNASVQDGNLVVYSQVDGPMGGATAAGLDDLCKAAAELA